MTAQNDVPQIVILNAAVDLADEYPRLDFAQAHQMMRTPVYLTCYWFTALVKACLRRGVGEWSKFKANPFKR